MLQMSIELVIVVVWHCYGYTTITKCQLPTRKTDKSVVTDLLVDGLIYALFSKNILMKLVGYQQPTCLCVKMEFVIEKISLSCELYSHSWSCFR